MSHRAHHFRCLLAVWLMVAPGLPLRAAPRDGSEAIGPGRSESPLLDDAAFRRVEQAIDRGLQHLARLQQPDGSFHANQAAAQPGITGLCTMCFLARGHAPGIGPYGDLLNNAIAYIVNCQHDTGILSVEVSTEERSIPSATYNHTIGGLTLAEVYGMTSKQQEVQLNTTLARAVEYSLQMQFRAQQSADDAGGWGYMPPHDEHLSDLSVVSWQIMFLRAAKNSGFLVPQSAIEDALAYVDRHYDPETGGFFYHPGTHFRRATPSMTAVGILMLSLGGQHDSAKIQQAADWLARHPWSMDLTPGDDNVGEYTAYYSMQAAIQLGDPYWSRISAPILDGVLQNQRPDGSWTPGQYGEQVGSAYTTSMYILTLAAPLQLLPIYQR